MYSIIFITASKDKEAEKIAKGLLESKLAACVNIVPRVKSYFWWEGKIDRADELLLIVKTRKSLVNKLIKKVKSLHGYTVPEVVAFPIINGNKDYLKWIDDSTK
ncbi:divalent-cation tolerance protein CutA [bacterium]|nr:MAG: divalent-cation tolerance protein CutA [bacterium]